MNITKENYISASFLQPGRNDIEILLRDDENKKIIPHIIQYDENHPSYQQLLSVTTLDQIHENTHNRVQGERKDFEEMAIRIAKKGGFVFDKGTEDSRFFTTLVKAIFEDGSNEDHLFALKLALFEFDKIRDSDNAELKAEIRKATTKADVLYTALRLFKGK